MYVSRLIEFAEEHSDLFPPIGFQKKRVDWIVDIEEGTLQFHEAEKKEMTVPTLARSGSGAEPILLVDKPDYVFGWSPSPKDAARSQKRNDAYIRLLHEYVQATGDQDVRLLLKALEKRIDFPEKLKLGDFIVFRIRHQEFLHEAESVKSFWSQFVQPSSDEGSGIATCMFCGKETTPMERHSINFVVNGERTKLISANQNAYDSHNNKHSTVAPTCYECEQKYGQALEYLLQRVPKTNYGRHMFSVGEVTYVYWLRGASTGSNVPMAMPILHKANLNEMKDELDHMFKGKKVHSNFKDFCLLVVTANKGRLVVRDYLEESMGIIHERIHRFLDAQNVGQERLYGVYALAAAIYQKPSTQLKKVDIPQWFDFVFRGQPLPGRILLAALKRIQAEGGMHPILAAVVKSWIVSQNEGSKRTMTTNNQNTTAYAIGRVFAVLEKIKEEANRPQGRTQDTLASRYFGSACATPRAVIAMLIKNAQYHLEKIAAGNKGRAVNLNNELTRLLAQVETFPAALKLEEQAEFALGYYHQKSMWLKKEERT